MLKLIKQEWQVLQVMTGTAQHNMTGSLLKNSLICPLFKKKLSVLLFGSTGVGKTMLA